MNLLTRFFAKGLVVVAAGASIQAASAQTLITSWTDGSFVLAPTGPWNVLTMSYGLYGTVSSIAQTTGGNPTDFRKSSILFPSTPKNYIARHVILALNSNATWTPTTSPTAFSHLNFSCDQYEFWVLNHPHQVLIEQDDKYYVGPSGYNIPWNQGGWVPALATNVVATDFNELNQTDLTFNTSSHPNFTNGPTMTFGYAFWGEHTWLGAITEGVTGIDNWSVALYRL